MSSAGDATVDIPGDAASAAIELSADSRSLEVRAGLGGVKPLTDRDRSEIIENINDKVLLEQPIAFRSSAGRPDQERRHLAVEGELTMVGTTRPVSFDLNAAPDGRVTGTIRLVQSDWGIRPYRALMGALKVRDEVEIVIDARLPVE